ncbi:MAG: 3-oxoacyl-[acyl-carrier-protein] reductase [Pseudomonadales bacterium]|nr:3-oxoacyl-[acyl-carrier-protein] reductase [Pseudomonadales bacterium]MDA0957590.1 3-oxoacyl-[acyl-carrier-protein] reductase [Pseudomonadota bacterium]MDA1207616.1 3-oxoacyl-[acyl-carrier-protein] reductase [Pseudomonadota bacterium]
MTKTAVITGASRGIGQAIAAAMVEAGYRVLGTATTEAGAENISALLGGKGRGYVVDLAVQQSVSNFLEALKQDQETPLILVNNAGITKDNLLMRMKAEEWHDVIATNLSGVFQLTQGLLRGMMKAKFGRVINLSSVVGRMGNGGQSNYAASKAGIEGFSRALGAEVASRNITVNSVAPGFIETDMTTALSSDQRSAMLARVPAARLGKPEEVAALVKFLASEDASYITGETLHINGGMYTA